jgi:hypothetical protein
VPASGIIGAVTVVVGSSKRRLAVTAAAAWLVTPVMLTGLAALEWRIRATGRADLAGASAGDLADHRRVLAVLAWLQPNVAQP